MGAVLYCLWYDAVLHALVCEPQHVTGYCSVTSACRSLTTNSCDLADSPEGKIFCMEPIKASCQLPASLVMAGY